LARRAHSSASASEVVIRGCIFMVLFLVGPDRVHGV
jgi:hypothetical protein